MRRSSRPGRRLALWEDRQLVLVFGEPRRFLGQIDKPVLDDRGLGVHAHDLVGLRLIAGDRVQALFDQLLDQLGARGFVLDHHDICLEGLALLARRALQFGILHALAPCVQQVKVLTLDAPTRGDAEVAKLARLIWCPSSARSGRISPAGRSPCGSRATRL